MRQTRSPALPTRRAERSAAASAGNDRLRRVLEAQHAIAAAGPELEVVFRVACEQLQALTGAEGAGILVLAGDQLVSRIPATGFLAEQGTLRASLDGTIAGLVHRRNRPLLVRDYEQDPLQNEHTRLLGIRSQIIVPLGNPEPIAQLHLASRLPDAFDEDDVETVELLSTFLVLALSRAAEAAALGRMQKIVDKVAVGIVRWDARRRVRSVNPSLERLLGYTEAELRGASLDDLVHEEDAARARTVEEAVLAGRTDRHQLETRYVRKDGSVLWTQTTAVRDGESHTGEPVGLSVLVDVSEGKLAELALRRNSEKLEQIVETQRDIAVAGHDLDSVLQVIAESSRSLTGGDGVTVSLIEGEELVVVAASGAMEPYLGRRRPLAGTGTAYAIETRRSFLAVDAEHDPRLNSATIARIGDRSHICVPLFQGERAIGSLNVGSRSETELLTEDDRQTLELLCVVLSAAMSREAEFDALARFQTVYDSAPLGIIVLLRGGKIIEANKAAQDLLGYSADELRGAELDSLIHPDDLELTHALRRQMIEGRRRGFEIERRYVRKDGSPVWTDSSVAYVYGQDGERMFAMTMIQDIDQRKAAEEQLRQAQKIEAIGQLTAGIAHDFNNLLMGVLGYAGFLRAEAEEGTRTAEYLDRIEETGRRAATLTQQLLAFGRQQALRPRRLDLNELVAGTVSMLGRVLGEQIEIEVDAQAELLVVRGDPTQLQQVLFNLALNARDAMPGGGSLVIATRNVEPASNELPATLTPVPRGYVLLSVADTGGGMAPEVLERIFEPFFTTKEVGEGSGLGLASVYGIVKQSGGEIEAESSLGRGTTFRIYLPSV